MQDGAALFTTIVNQTVNKLQKSDNLDIEVAVDKSIKETIAGDEALDALLQYVEIRTGGVDTGDSYKNLIDDISSEVEELTANGETSYALPSENIECDDMISPANPWYIGIYNTQNDWEDVKEILPDIDCNVPLKLVSSEDEVTSHAHLMMFSDREDAEEAYEDMVPSAVITEDDDGETVLSIVDLEFGVIDFRPNPHPILEPMNERLNYPGTDYIYLLPLGTKAMFTEPDSGLWVAVDSEA